MKKLCYSYLFIFAIMMSCKPNMKTETTFFWVNSSKVDCVGVAPMQCLQVKRSETGKWENFYDGIDGFNFQPGYLYKLEVVITPLDKENLPADKSSLKHTLHKVISKEKDTRLRLNDIWVVTKIEDKLLDKSTMQLPRLEISVKDMQLLGTDGCNNIRGSIKKIGAKELIFGSMMGTKKLCPQMEIPNAFNRIIGTVTHYKIENRTLYFYNKNENEVMQCLKVD